MKSRSFLTIFVILCSLIFITIKQAHCDEMSEWDEEATNQTSFYTAGVLELNLPTNLSEPETIVGANLIEYIKWVEKAADQGVDILVFPESTLNYHGKHYVLFSSYGIDISSTFVIIRHFIQRRSFTCSRRSPITCCSGCHRMRLFFLRRCE